MVDTISKTLGPALEVKDLSLQLNGVDILHDVNLLVEPGSIHCLIGPNGGGKTCLLKSILGQMPHRGEVRVSAEDKPVTGYVPQLLDFDKALPVTVNDFMAIVANGSRPAFTGLTRQAGEAASAALSRVGFQGSLTTRLGSLSGGERQRVLFAQALIPQPSLLILDEPFNNIDQQGEEILLELINELAASGVTILWVAHNLKQVREFADKLSCVNGNIVYSGAPEEFLDSMQAEELFHLSVGRTGTARGAAS
ncbi:MAG: manganese transporter [Pseudohongiella sp.]|nr:MAG: manganese transporter [Pseudohongiella sp.]